MSEPASKLTYSPSSMYIEEIDFQKYWLVLKRRWLPTLLTFGTVLGLSMLATMAEDPKYQAIGRVQIRSDRAPSLTGLGDELGQVEVLTFQSEPLGTQAQVVRSLPLMEAVIDRLDLRNAEGEPLSPSSLLRSVKVESVEGTEILRIIYEGDDAEESAEIVNEIIAAYQEQNIASNRQEAASARQFIEEQLPAVEANVLAAEAALSSFKEENNIISLQEEAIYAVEVLSVFDQNLAELQAQLAELNARSGELQRRLSISSSDANALGSLNQAQGVQAVLGELQAVQAQLAVERSRYRPGHPAIAELEREQAQLENLLANRVQTVLGTGTSVTSEDLQFGQSRQGLIAELTNLEIERTGLMNRMAQLAQSQAAYRQRANSLPNLEKTQRELERRLDAYRITYETLLTQLQEIRVIENQTVGNVRIISLAAVPSGPIGSNSKLFVVAGGVAGVLLGVAVAFLLDLLDSSVKTTQEARELLGYTLLGVIPKVDEAASRSIDPSYPRLLVHDEEHIAVREAYQMLQANLKFLQSDEELKTFVITSSTTGEGKSEVCANLAAVLAQVGKRVLVVDADMRYPRQHHAMGVMNNLGLSHVIAGQAELEAAIQTVTENLDVLTAGVVPPNPIALLDSKRMETLLASFTQHYDAVIVDVPPMVGYADASIVGKMSDGLIFVVRPGLVSYDQVRTAKEVLERSHQRTLGMVVNGVNAKNEPTSYFSEATRFPKTALPPSHRKPKLLAAIPAFGGKRGDTVDGNGREQNGVNVGRHDS